MSEASARITECDFEDSDVPGVGLVLVDEDGAIGDVIIAADTLDHLRPQVANLMQAFEFPVLTAETDSVPEDESGPTGLTPAEVEAAEADREAVAAREAEDSERPMGSENGPDVPSPEEAPEEEVKEPTKSGKK